MSNARHKYIPPGINELAFNCPHCGALAKQFWHTSHAEPLKANSSPTIIRPEELSNYTFDDIENPEDRERYKRFFAKVSRGRPFLDASRKNIDYYVANLSISQCFNCDEVSIWIYDRLVWPTRGEAPPANADLPDDVRADYDEASTILDLSPRGAAALLRFAIQRLCRHLGEKGDNINGDIAALVKRGLHVHVQQALDVVRVVGNNAVHPGQIDLRDDRATAEKLFGLVNLIAEIMISQPKHVQAMYESLPDSAKKAIEGRDGRNRNTK